LALTRPGSSPSFTAPEGALDSLARTQAERPAALFVGDSYTAGSGTAGPRLGYACLAAEQMDWICNLDAQSGTGYINDGSLNSVAFRPFAQRLGDDAKRFRADVVIVDGGRNDVSPDLDGVAAAAADYLRAVRSQWPQARLVVVVPYFLSSTPQSFPFAERLGARLREIVQPLGGIVIDPMASGWVPAPDVAALLSPDGIHPNADGHRYLAEHFSGALREAGMSDVPITDGGATPTPSPGR
jgi:lysophospholipase L1-like esterase